MTQPGESDTVTVELARVDAEELVAYVWKRKRTLKVWKAILAIKEALSAAVSEPRDLAWERLWSQSAARSAGVDAHYLTAFAEERSGEGPVRDLSTRDFLQEVLEELADARNYLVWKRRQMELHAAGWVDEDCATEVLAAAAHIAAAFALVRRLKVAHA